MNALIRQQIQQPDTQVYIRYVGATSRTTPAQRLQADMDAARVQGQRRFSNFCRVMMDMDLGVQFELHEVHLLRVQGVFGEINDNHELLDATERFLIHLLHRSYLLNSQPGGYFISYQPLPQEQ